MLILICCNNADKSFQKNNGLIYTRVNELFSFWQARNFDSLYSHMDSSARTIPRDSFIELENGIYPSRINKNFKIIKYNLNNDSTFQISFTFDMYNSPNDRNYQFSSDPKANKIDFWKRDTGIWQLKYCHNTLLFHAKRKIKKY